MHLRTPVTPIQHIKHWQKLVLFIWLGIVNLFQTFEDLEGAKDKQTGKQTVRRLVDESEDP
jgi:hypothetical protein